MLCGCPQANSNIFWTIDFRPLFSCPQYLQYLSRNLELYQPDLFFQRYKYDLALLLALASYLRVAISEPINISYGQPSNSPQPSSAVLIIPNISLQALDDTISTIEVIKRPVADLEVELHILACEFLLIQFTSRSLSLTKSCSVVW